MLTHEVTLESKEFGILKGRKLTLRVPENRADCEALTKSGESDVVARFSESIVRAQNNLARSQAAGVLKKEPDADKALAILQANINAYQYSEREAGTGVASKPKTPAGIKKSKAAASGNRLFEKCAQDADFLKRMVKQGIVDETEFADWQTASAAEKAAATAAPTPATT